MRDVLASLSDQHEELDNLLAGLDIGGWARPTRCPGWTVADVVLHLAQTDELAVASIEGRLYETELGTRLAGERGGSVDDRVAAMVAAERGAPPARLLARWRAASTAVRAALGGSDPSARVSWVAGQLSARTLATTRLAESWIHTGDIAEPLGLPVGVDDRLWHIARLAWRTLPYAFARAGTQLAGPVALRLVGPDGEPWNFGEDTATTVVHGDAVAFCLLAARRRPPQGAGPRAEGPDASAVLELVRTFA